MLKEQVEEINLQRNQVFSNNFTVDLIAPCTPGNGLLQLSDLEQKNAIKIAEGLKKLPVFFIPASGSGSRMFQFLYDWMETGEDTPLSIQFFEEISKLAMFEFNSFKLDDLKDQKAFVKNILDGDKLNYGGKPKGLIPFHIENGEIYNAFQDQVRQAVNFIGNNVEVHFTIQKQFEELIRKSITAVNDKARIHFSYQDGETNAFCFKANQEVFEENGKQIKRPAGHGALLDNLNEIDADIVLIKNIDNVQNSTKSNDTKKTWKMILGVLKQFQNEMLLLKDEYSKERLIAINDKYQFLSNEELESFDSKQLELVLNRPTRVCGMVINQGEPGGGPFWVKSNKGVTKQIVENAQISSAQNQMEIINKSTHFNPVFIAALKTNMVGERLNLLDFKDDSAFFVVKKSHKGKDIYYRELPGLWNGSMSNWNTIFVETPISTFSPVKTVMDLTKLAHLEKEN